MKCIALSVLYTAMCIATFLLVMPGSSACAQATQPGPTNQRLSARLPINIDMPFCQGRQSWADFSEYSVELLRLAAAYSNRTIVLEPVCMEYPTEKRRIAMLQSGDEINIVPFGTSPRREKLLRAVHFPVFLGTTGLRMFITLPETSARLETVTSLEDLRHFTFGQGLGWPDSDILKENGMPVIEGRYQTLHAMLARQRFDIYPRAYWQIRNEHNWMHEKEPSLVINPHMALYYPQPIYFFVSPTETELHDAVLNGLERAWHDGAVMALLRKNRETGPSFRTINPTELHIIHLPSIVHTAETDSAMQKYGLVDGSNFTIAPATQSSALNPKH